MKAIAPLLADGIDVPLVFLFGVAVLVPLMAFQVGVEGAILARLWRLSFRELARGVFLANCWSLAAGIPVKIFNGWLFYWLLPTDLAGFFARYPYTVMLGTGIYFLVTWRVEARYLLKWLAPPESRPVFRARVSSGVLVANLATYAVLAPVHYFATRPIHNIQEFTANTAWATSRPRACCIDSATRLKSTDTEVRSGRRLFHYRWWIIRLPPTKLCLFRAPDGNCICIGAIPGVAALVWKPQNDISWKTWRSVHRAGWSRGSSRPRKGAGRRSAKFESWDMRWVGSLSRFRLDN